MKKITILLLTLYSISTFGQITYNSTDFALVNENQVVSRTSTGLLTLDFATTGTNFSWDYSSLSPATQETITYVNPNSTGYKPTWCLQNGFVFNCNTQFNNTFNLANNVAEGIQIQGNGLTNVFEHSKITATDLSSKMLGATISVSGVNVPLSINYAQPDVIYNFPINYNNNNTNTSSYSIDLNSLGIPLSLTNTSQRTNLVEGWGSLTTPFGTFANVLKMKTTLVQNNTVNAQGQTTTTTRTTVIYKWFDTAYGIPVLEVTGELIGSQWIPTNATYVDNQLCLSPNALFAYLPIPADYNPTTQSSTVSFINLSTNYDTSSWNFGDGSAISTETNPAHTFTCPGLKQVTLTVTNTFCNPIQTSTIILPVNITDTQNSFTTNVTVNGNTLTADRILTGTTYQWLDCDNSNAIISGETNQSFTPTQSGNYAVQLTTNGCQSVSSCYNTQVLSTTNNNGLSKVVLYPNPTTGILNLSDNQLIINSVSVYNVLGKLILDSLDLSTVSKGIYLVKIETDKGILIKNIVKE